MRLPDPGSAEARPIHRSVHMRVLHQAGLVEKRRQGKWVYFRLVAEESIPQSRAAIRLVAQGLRTAREYRVIDGIYRNF